MKQKSVYKKYVGRSLGNEEKLQLFLKIKLWWQNCPQFIYIIPDHAQNYRV